MHNRLSTLISLFFAGFILTFTVLFSYFLCKKSAYESQKGLIIASTNLDEVAEVFRLERIVNNADIARFYLRLARAFGYQIRIGEFEIPSNVSLREAIEILDRAKSIVHKICIYEGMSVFLFLKRLEKDEYLLGKVEQVPAEGSLMPATYSFTYPTTRQEIIFMAQKAMREFIKREWPRRAPNCIMKTPEEALTLASIVEKETSLESEKNLVAGVYGHRLRIGMKLQADPTTIYAMKKGDVLGRRLTYSDLKYNDAYNTYMYDGLPPGPIANPGRSSIMAVLHPEDTDFLFFVCGNNSSHIFSKTFEEHKEKIKTIRKAKSAK